MNIQLMFLAQLKTGALFEILALLLVAGIIGFVTSWLYQKSIAGKTLIEFNAEKKKLEDNIEKLKSEKSNLHENLREKEKEIRHITLELKALRGKRRETDHETKVQPRNSINYASFGTATEAEKDDLKMISGIGPAIEERLNSLNIFTFKQISRFTEGDIETLNNTIIYFSGRIDRDKWVEQAQELVHDEERRTALFKRISSRKDSIYYNRIGTAKKEEADDLTLISGIGGWIMKKLNILDIYTFRQISNFNNEDIQAVTDAIEYFPGRIERDEWILQAKELLRIASDKVELLKRIKERKGRIYYDRLGNAHIHQANNLTLIDGLGSWVEERLNTLDIFTFDQISRLTHEDIITITEVLELIPGQIEKDNWVGQAYNLAGRRERDYLKLVN